MERSRALSGLYKGRYIDSSSQRSRIRLSDLEQALEDEDYIEEGFRYSTAVKASRSIEGSGAQSRRLGKNSRVQED